MKIAHSRLVLLLAALALVAAACGVDEDVLEEDGEAAPVEDPDEEETIEEIEEVDAEGTTFVYIAPAVTETLDPNIHTGDPSRWFGFERGGGLFWYDTSGLAGEGQDEYASVEELTGELAESWEFNEDRTQVTVTLREMLSPFGNELTSEDVQWTTERWFAQEGSITGALMAGVNPADPFVEIIDDRTLTFNYEEPTAIDLAVMTWHAFAPLDSIEVQRHATDDDPWGDDFLESNTATFGPWQVVEEDFIPGEQVVFRKNDNYWGERGNVDTLIMRAVSDAGTRTQLLQTGEAHYAGRLPLDRYAGIEDDPNVDVVVSRSADTDAIGLNHDDEALADPDVRRAIALAVDRNALVDGPYRGFFIAQPTGLSTVYDGVEQHAEISLEHDPDAAGQLLEDAGYADGVPLTFTYNPTRPGPEAEETAILLQSQLNDVGFDVELDVIPGSAEFAGALIDGSLQMFLNVLPPAVPDIAYGTNLYYFSEGSQNQFNYASGEVDEMFFQFRGMEPGDPERAEIVGQFADLLATDLPVVPLVERQFIRAFTSNVSGHVFQPSGEVFAHKLTIAE